MKLDTKDFERKMQKSIEVYKENLATIRAGRANAAVLGNITVDYYGAATLITQLGEVKIPDPKTLVIQPWDASVLKNIEKAILASDIGINPQNDGKVIRLVFPQLTEERRKELKKSISKMGEDAKVNVRNIRRDTMDALKKQEKAKEITEDELTSLEEKVQKLTDKYVADVEKKCEAKCKDILSV